MPLLERTRMSPTKELTSLPHLRPGTRYVPDRILTVDEFIALLPETSAASARIVLEKLRAGLADLRTTDGRAAAPSIGGVTFLNPPRGVEEIVRATDERITEAKATGTPSHVTWNAAPAPGLEGR